MDFFPRMNQLDSGGRMADRFQNRRTAGIELARELHAYANDPHALVLALPRGGVPVAYEIARALNLPLDVFIVRKLGVPGYEELALGAIASGGVRVLNDEVVRRTGISPAQIEKVAQREQQEIQRREWEYRGDLPPLNVRGKTVTLIDDGLATGATMHAAVEALRQSGADRIVVAVPVGSTDACERIAREADELICPLQPYDFEAVSAWYLDFSQTSDEEVHELLAERVHAPT